MTQDGFYTLKDTLRDECFHSRLGAKLEAESLYLTASGVDFAKKEQSILDVGLGPGYNAVSTLVNWQQTPNAQDLELLSLEIDPEIVKIVTTENNLEIYKNWDDSWKNCLWQFKETEPNFFNKEFIHPTTKSKAFWTIWLSDMSQNDFLKAKLSKNGWDYIWYDPFSPKKNPELWTKDIFSKLKARVHAETVLMTYSCSRAAKDALTEAGWRFELLKTQGPKKKWLKAQIIL